jgi:hypothetical protein
MTEETNIEGTVEAAPEPVATEAAPEATVTEAAPETVATPEPPPEEISYHAVQKDGTITAIWEMRGRKHLRTIDPRSEEGRHLLGHPDHPETQA